MMEKKSFLRRRTGVAFLSLALATNLIPWMELLTGESAAEDLISPGDFLLPVGLCLLAAILVFAAWMSGRHRPIPEKPRFARPRILALRLQIVSMILNLSFAAWIMTRGANLLAVSERELILLAVAWVLLALPLQIAAAFIQGRVSQEAERRFVALSQGTALPRS
jgi:phosphoglycerol transferase MdoB-like AlkP superfamily enzyme